MLGLVNIDYCSGLGIPRKSLWVGIVWHYQFETRRQTYFEAGNPKWDWMKKVTLSFMVCEKLEDLYVLRSLLLALKENQFMGWFVCWLVCCLVKEFETRYISRSKSYQGLGKIQYGCKLTLLTTTPQGLEFQETINITGLPTNTFLLIRMGTKKFPRSAGVTGFMKAGTIVAALHVEKSLNNRTN